MLLLLALAPAQIANLTARGVTVVGRYSLKLILWLVRFGEKVIEAGRSAFATKHHRVEVIGEDGSEGRRREQQNDKASITNSGVTQEEVRLARSPGSSPEQIQAREKVALNYLESNGHTDSQIKDALGSADGSRDGGVDLTKPLEVIEFPPPDKMSQYVGSHGYPGNWFDPVGDQTPDMLGINGEGRTLTSFEMPVGSGLKSHSKPILDTWTDPDNPIQTNGGGVQLFVNNETREGVLNLNGLGQ